MIDKDRNEKFRKGEFRTLMFKITNNDKYFFIVDVIIDINEMKTFNLKNY